MSGYIVVTENDLTAKTRLTTWVRDAQHDTNPSPGRRIVEISHFAAAPDEEFEVVIFEATGEVFDVVAHGADVEEFTEGGRTGKLVRCRKPVTVLDIRTPGKSRIRTPVRITFPPGTSPSEPTTGRERTRTIEFTSGDTATWTGNFLETWAEDNLHDIVDPPRRQIKSITMDVERRGETLTLKTMPGGAASRAGNSSPGAAVVRENGKEGRIAVYNDFASFEIQTGEDVGDPARRIPTKVVIIFPPGTPPPDA